jgi:hypothetical protein
MKAYFLNISEEEKKSIKDKHTKLYDGYVTRESKQPNEIPLSVGNYALDEDGITVNNKGEVSEYKNKNINQKLKSVCEQCGSEISEGEMCECGAGGMYENEECMECGSAERYTENEIKENVILKSKSNVVMEEINNSLNWFKRIL